MGRHGAGQHDGPQHARDTGTKFGDLGPVTDPFLLDALPLRPRRERDAPAPDEDAPAAGGPSRPDHRAEASPAPWAPRPVVRRTETPFSGPIALPDPEEPGVRPQPEQPPAALHEPVRSASATPPPRPAPASVPDDRTPAVAPSAAPRSLPALLGGDGTPAATPAMPPGTSAPADDPEEQREPDAVGLSVRTLLLSLGVGVLAAVALSVVAILPL